MNNDAEEEGEIDLLEQMENLSDEGANFFNTKRNKKGDEVEADPSMRAFDDLIKETSAINNDLDYAISGSPGRGSITGSLLDRRYNQKARHSTNIAEQKPMSVDKSKRVGFSGTDSSNDGDKN